MSSQLQNVELYLLNGPAPVLHRPSPWRGWVGTRASSGLVLEGGFHLLVKPSEHRSGRSARAVKNASRGLAGKQIARMLGSHASMTVVRPFTSWQTGATGVLSSAQVVWPAIMPGPSFADIPEIQRSWIAAFDYVTGCTDREEGQHNWLAVKCEQTGDTQIKIFDNGFSWDYRVGESAFVRDRRGVPLAAEILHGVRRLQDGAAASPLAPAPILGREGLLDPVQLANLNTRCAAVLASGIIP